VTRRIVLVRHGRSAHVHRGWMDIDGFREWRTRYEAAGIVAGELAPPELVTLAASSGIVVASDAPRALESARLLAPQREIASSPLLREMELSPPAIRIRLPLHAWALTFLWRWLVTRRLATDDEVARATDAARWLASLAAAHESVVAVTHHGIRDAIGKALVAGGWTRETRRRKSSHWSAWSYSR
jgi:broad specificity phosphatase PhoE